MGVIPDFQTAIISILCHDCDKDPNNCYWIQYLIILVSLVTWFQLCTDILVCLPIPNIAQYLNMFQYVSRTYLHIIGCFLPFMAFFAVCFKSKNNNDKMIVFWNITSNCKNFIHLLSTCQDLFRPWLILFSTYLPTCGIATNHGTLHFRYPWFRYLFNCLTPEKNIYKNFNFQSIRELLVK